MLWTGSIAERMDRPIKTRHIAPRTTILIAMWGAKCFWELQGMVATEVIIENKETAFLKPLNNFTEGKPTQNDNGLC